MFFNLLLITCFILVVVNSAPLKSATDVKIYGAENNKYCAKTDEEKEEELQAETEAQDDMTKGKIIEGDMRVNPKLTHFIEKSKEAAAKKAAAKVAAKRDGTKLPEQSFSNFKRDFAVHFQWPSTELPYALDSSVDSTLAAVIQTAINDFQNYTCLTFKPRTAESDYLQFTSEATGCWSFVGHTGGIQQLNSQSPGCRYKGTVIHEIMHALGFFHEHTRLDRDDYVTINFENIQSGKENNFQKYLEGAANTFGASYDVDSVMHYGSHAFSKNGNLTIVPKTVHENVIGQRAGFSPTDIQQINKAYCDTAPTQPPIIPPVTTVAPVTTAAPTGAGTTVTPVPTPTTASPETVPTTTATSTDAPVSSTVAPVSPTDTPAVTPSVTNPVTPATTTKQPTPATRSTGHSTPVVVVTNPVTLSLKATTKGTGKSTPVPPAEKLPPTPPHPGPSGNNGSVVFPILIPHVGLPSTLGCQRYDYFPCWPTSFTVNQCSCPQVVMPTCRCKCVKIKGSNNSTVHNNHNNNNTADDQHLCYRKTIRSPNFKFSSNGEIRGMKCTHLGTNNQASKWRKNYLCHSPQAPYNLRWVNNEKDVNTHEGVCLKFKIPNQQESYLCNSAT